MKIHKSHFVALASAASLRSCPLQLSTSFFVRTRSAVQVVSEITFGLADRVSRNRQSRIAKKLPFNKSRIQFISRHHPCLKLHQREGMLEFDAKRLSLSMGTGILKCPKENMENY